MKKTELHRKIIDSYINLLKCPICGSDFKLMDTAAVKCKSSHNYDISSKGYINFCGGTKSEFYSKELFEARRRAFGMGFFMPICEKIAAVTGDRLKNGAGTILDAGCGEGSALNNVLEMLNSTKPVGVRGIGLDISKEGIKAAASFRDKLWLVGDIARIPISDSSVDVLLNILSPANYSEFARVVKTDGYIIKVIPGEDYLKELRENLQERPGEAEELFKTRYSTSVIEEHELRYNFSLLDSSAPGDLPQSEKLASIIGMTPLCRNDMSARNDKRIPEGICVHIKILVAKMC